MGSQGAGNNQEPVGSGCVDDRVAIEVQRDEFTVILAQFEAIEPEAILVRMRKPRAGLGLAPADHYALDRCGPHFGNLGHLLHHAHARTGLERKSFKHGREYSRASREVGWCDDHPAESLAP